MSNNQTIRQCPAPRVALACKQCRLKKGRCLPSKMDGVCQRCYNAKIKCEHSIPHNNHGRQHRHRDVSVSSTTPQQGDILSTLYTNAEQRMDGKDEQPLPSLHKRHLEKMFPTSDMAKESTGSIPNRVQSQQNPESEKEYVMAPPASLSSQRAEEYLKTFRDVSAIHFPFVILSESWTMSKLSQSRPMLLFGILVAMSAESPRIQRRLDRGFREVISERVVVRGDKSLDLLQGLLVFLAWFPVQQNPKNRALFQFLQMARTMATDLRLDEVPETSNSTVGDKAIDEKRALLGCYYLSSAYSVPPRRLNTMEFGKNCQQYLDDFTKQPSVPSDYALVTMISLQRTNEQATKTGLSDLQISSVDDQIMTGCISNLLTDTILAMNQNTETNPSAFIGLGFRYTQMNVYAIALSSNQTSPNHLQYINDCVIATKAVLQELKTYDMWRYRYFSFVEWCRFIGTITTLFRLITSISNFPSLDTSTIHELSNFKPDFEVLIFRMSELSNKNEQNVGPNLFFLWESVLRAVCEHYLQLVTDMKHRAATLMPRMLDLCPVMNGRIHHTDYWNAFTTENTNQSNGNGDLDVALTSFGVEGFDWSDILAVNNMDLDRSGEVSLSGYGDAMYGTTGTMS